MKKEKSSELEFEVYYRMKLKDMPTATIAEVRKLFDKEIKK